MALDPQPPAQEISLTRFGGLFTFIDPRDLPSGASPLCHDVDFLIAGVGPRPGLAGTATTGTPQFFTSYLPLPSIGGAAQQLVQYDNEKVYFGSTLIYTFLPSCRSLGVTASNGREFVSASNLTQGLDRAFRFDGNSVYPVGPGAPGHAAIAITTTPVSYPIAAVVQPYPAQTVYSIIWGVPLNDVNAPPPSNVLTFLSAVNSTTFNTGINPGDIVYVTGLPANTVDGLNANGTYTVIGTGAYVGRYGAQQYIQVQSDQAGGTFSGPFTGATLQKTKGFVVVGPTPVPPQYAGVGQSIQIAGNLDTNAHPTGWNGTWPIVDTPAQGLLNIVNTSQTHAANPTYGFSIADGNAPGYQLSHNYLGGEVVVDQNGAGHAWLCVRGGLSLAAAYPGWPVTPTANQQITGNQEIWQYIAGLEVFGSFVGLTNDNGLFNGFNLQIIDGYFASFTAANPLLPTSGPTITQQAENGSALTGAGIVFAIDPGQNTLASGHPGQSPILTAPAGTTLGSVAVEGTDLAPGQRYAIALFQTDSGYITPASPPISFNTSGVDSTITFTGIPAGPGGSVATIFAITGANAGIGGPYFYIPQAVNIPATYNAFTAPRTISSTVAQTPVAGATLGPLTITDAVLQSSVNVTETGNNAQQQRPLGSYVKAVQFGGRMFYLGERAKVDQFYNMDFAGGTLGASGPPVPGWTYNLNGSPNIPGLFAVTQGTSGTPSVLTINSSASYNINGSSVLPAAYYCLQQSAYQTPYGTNLFTFGQSYSARIVAASTNGSASTSLGIDIYSPSKNVQYGKATIALNTLTAAFSETDISNLLPATALPLPSDAVLRIYPLNLLINAAGISVRSIELYPSLQPVYSTSLSASYENNPEAVDAVSGILDFSSITAETLTNVYRFLDTLYATTASRTMRVTRDPTTEPAEWPLNEVSNRAGCCGPMAQDSGEEFSVSADANGVYVFDGGNHIKISQEIQGVWNLLNQAALNTIWVKNDVANQRLFIGVPLPTPNQWLPNAPTNSAPATPNVILMCSYVGVETGAQLGGEEAVTVSMFTGSLLYREMRRKWTIWQIPAQYGDWMPNPIAGSPPLFYLGQTNSLSYLSATATNDNGTAIPQLYTTYGMPDARDEEQLRLGSHRHQFLYLTTILEGTGKATILTIPETLTNTMPALTQPAFTLASPALDDVNMPLITVGNRMFVQFASSGLNSQFSLRRVVAAVLPSPRIPVRGQ